MLDLCPNAYEGQEQGKVADDVGYGEEGIRMIAVGWDCGVDILHCVFGRREDCVR